MTSDDRDALPAEDGTKGSGNDRDRASRSSHVEAEHRADSESDERTEATTVTATKEKKTKRKELPIWQETILLVGVALVLAIVIKAFFAQAFYIPSESMEPGLIKNDRILVQKVSYWGSGTPQRGDVVVFKDPGGWLGPQESQGPKSLVASAMAKVGLYPTGGHLVKRVIAVGGDTVKCCDKQGRLKINGKPMNESTYVLGDAECAAPQSPVNCELDVTIPEGYLLMMGDNRGNSRDSTAHMCADPEAEQCPPTRGLVPVEDVVGKVAALVWPRDRFHRLKRPAVFEDVPDPK